MVGVWKLRMSSRGKWRPSLTQNTNQQNTEVNKLNKTKKTPRNFSVFGHLMSILKQLLLSCAQAEDQALLPEGDEQIDQRQWTQQHLEAADVCGSTSLALTPPQADQEVDVLDVNVRGPGQYSVCPCLLRSSHQPLQWLGLLTFKNHVEYTGTPAAFL